VKRKLPLLDLWLVSGRRLRAGYAHRYEHGWFDGWAVAAKQLKHPPDGEPAHRRDRAREAASHDDPGVAEKATSLTVGIGEHEDTLGAFLVARCDLSGEVAAAELRAAYDAYCAELGEKPLSAAPLGRELVRRGIATAKSNGRRVYRGLSLK
jgi:hypothetical protein